MQVATLEQFFFSPNVIFVFLAILTCIANIIIGVNILPRDKREKGYKLHKNIFRLAVIWYAFFLAMNHNRVGNGFWEYFVLVYFLVVIPWSRKINITLHTIVTSSGVIMLVGIITFRLL
ncbi:MAG: hypothetical protein VYC17_01615 [Nitrospinota bacterium]|nr:hypothetical protein [Nitrospinota bacterium]